MAEAGGGNAGVLGVVERHAFAHRGIETGNDGIVPDAEGPDSGRDPRDDRHRQLALVRLADPSPAAELLQNAGALALRVAPREGQPDVQREQDQGDDQEA